MALNHPNGCRPLLIAGLLGVAAAGWSAPARAQGLSVDPYQPYNAQYQQFTYPQYPNGIGLVPNQDFLSGRVGVRNSNRFQDFLYDIEGEDTGGMYRPRPIGPGIPYYSAYRLYDRDYSRVYRPNQASDRAFYEDQQARHDKYLEYLRERNPKKRAQLYQEYRRTNLKATRDLNLSRNALLRGTSRTGVEKEATGGLQQRRARTAPGLGSTEPDSSGAALPRSNGRTSSTRGRGLSEAVRPRTTTETTPRGTTTTPVRPSPGTTTPAPR